MCVYNWPQNCLTQGKAARKADLFWSESLLASHQTFSDRKSILNDKQQQKNKEENR